MIISRRHGIFFLHNRKTAGSSICVSLARLLGPEDVQISAIRETVAAGIPLTDKTLAHARSHCRVLSLARLGGARVYANMVARSVDHSHRALLGRKPPHAPAERVASAFPEEWQAYRKICVVRNPWDKTVSDYFWRIKAVRAPPGFADYVRALERGDDLGGVVPVDLHDNWPLYTIGDQIVAHELVRFEGLKEGLSDAFRSVGLTWDGWLPHAKASTRETRAGSAGYRGLYDDETAEIVGRLYCREIQAFGYRF